MMIKVSATEWVCEKCTQRYSTEQKAKECEYKCGVLWEIRQCKEFEITERHLTLIQRQTVNYNQWTNYGATEIDPKRPYGNSWVEGDIADILGIKPEGEDRGEPCFTSKQELDMWKMHVETFIALQICIQFMEFKTGVYRRGGSWADWERCRSDENG